jgi:hypothetical protein
MKKMTFITALIFALALVAKGQSNKEEIEYFQSIFGMEKKAVVAEFIKLEGMSEEAFWTLYDQYETERKAHGQKRIALLNKYAEQYVDLDDAATEEMMGEMIALGNEYNKLIVKYYKSIKKASGIKAAAQFYQLEAYFQSVIRLKIFESIPFIGEFDF